MSKVVRVAPAKQNGEGSSPNARHSFEPMLWYQLWYHFARVKLIYKLDYSKNNNVVVQTIIVLDSG